MVCITLTACRQNETEEIEHTNPLEEQLEKQKQEVKLNLMTSEKIFEEVSSTTKLPPPKSVISTKKLERQLLNEDSTVTLLRGEYFYPQVDNSDRIPSVDRLNEEIQKNTEEKFEKAFNEAADYVKEFYGQEGTTSTRLPFVIEQKVEVTNNQDYIVSFKITSYDDLGGAHPNILQSAYTYDVRTGEKLKASHFVGGDEEGVKQLVGQSFYTIVTEQPDEFYENALDILSKGQFEFGFYIDKGSITFFINPYIIAPYVGGVHEVSLLLR